MWRFRPIYLLSISVLVALMLSQGAKAQAMYPANVGDRMKYTFSIELPKAYLNGICFLHHAPDGVVRGSLFNEFGISAFDFSYYPEKDKVKLHHVIKMMDKWYIRRMLRHDLREVLHGLQQEKDRYTNDKHHISYQFTYLNNEE